jgi:hypothetical protein
MPQYRDDVDCAAVCWHRPVAQPPADRIGWRARAGPRTEAAARLPRHKQSTGGHPAARRRDHTDGRIRRHYSPHAAPTVRMRPPCTGRSAARSLGPTRLSVVPNPEPGVNETDVIGLTLRSGRSGRASAHRRRSARVCSTASDVRYRDKSIVLALLVVSQLAHRHRHFHGRVLREGRQRCCAARSGAIASPASDARSARRPGRCVAWPRPREVSPSRLEG